MTYWGQLSLILGQLQTFVEKLKECLGIDKQIEAEVSGLKTDNFTNYLYRKPSLFSECTSFFYSI